MYYELLGEIARKGISKKQLAKEIGMSEKTLFNKLNGKTDFTWSEVKKIKKSLHTNLSLEKLFQNSDLAS